MAKYKLDPAHTSAGFSTRHMMIATVRSQFKNVNGTLEFDPDNPAASKLEATVDVKTMAPTGVEDRDIHLLSPDFLNAEKFPTMTFKSTRVEMTGEKKGKVHGDLTIRDVTKTVVLDVEFLGQVQSLDGNTVAGFTGSGEINREDWGLVWNVTLETGGWLVGKEVKIDLDCEAILVTEEAETPATPA